MKKVSLIFCFTIGFLSCNRTHKHEDKNGDKKTFFINKSFDHYGSFDALDSLINTVNNACDEEQFIDSVIIMLDDSIKQVKDQIAARLDSNKSNQVKMEEYLKGYKEVLLKNQYTDSLFFDYMQSLLYHSSGKSSGRGYLAKCFRVQLLRSHLYFLKAIFENSFDSYEW
mgnify:CR=1 FL=1